MGAVNDLRRTLLDFKREHDFGRASIDTRLHMVAPLLDQLEQSIRLLEAIEQEARALFAATKLNPVYAVADPFSGPEPLTMRWVVAKQPEFHNAIEALRQRLPQPSETFRT